MSFSHKAVLFGFLSVVSSSTIYSQEGNVNNNRYTGDDCGICYKENPEVYWFNPKTRCAHEKCYKLIQPCQQELMQLFEQEEISTRNTYHIIAAGAVQKACGELSIADCYANHGQNVVTNLFNRIGTRAILENILEKQSALDKEKCQIPLAMSISSKIEKWSPEQLQLEIKRQENKLDKKMQHNQLLLSRVEKFYNLKK